jgi:hypothetical protein
VSDGGKRTRLFLFVAVERFIVPAFELQRQKDFEKLHFKMKIQDL